MTNGKPSCAIFLDIENQADVDPLALIEFFERRFEVEGKTACAAFSRPNMRGIERRLVTANINMVHIARPVKTECPEDDLADYALIKQIWATYRERGSQISTFVIVSGDGKFTGAVIGLKQLSKTVIVVADPSRIGPCLREKADRFIPLVNGRPVPGNRWMYGDNGKTKTTAPARAPISDDWLVQRLLKLEEANHYLTFSLVAHRVLDGDNNKASRRRLFDQLEAFVADELLLKYTHHDLVKNKNYPAIRLNRSHSRVQRVLSTN